MYASDPVKDAAATAVVAVSNNVTAAASVAPAGSGLRGMLPVTRLLASVMLGMGIFCLLSGGVAVLSCAMVIAQASFLLHLTSSLRSLVTSAVTRHVGALARAAGNDDCGCSGGTGTLRALSVAGMVLSIVDLIWIMSALPLLSLIYSSPFSGSFGCTEPRVQTCYTISIGSYYGASFWLLFAAGHGAVTAVLNLAWSVTIFKLMRIIKMELRSSGAPLPLYTERDSLIASAFAGSARQAAFLPQQQPYPHASYAPPPPPTLQVAAAEGPDTDALLSFQPSSTTTSV